MTTLAAMAHETRERYRRAGEYAESEQLASELRAATRYCAQLDPHLAEEAREVVLSRLPRSLRLRLSALRLSESATLRLHVWRLRIETDSIKI